jgi:hypothetical protein
MAQGDADRPFDEVAAALLPRIQSRFYHEVARMTFAARAKPGEPPPADKLLSRPFTDELALDLVQDFPTSLSSITAKALADWGKSFDDVLAIAKENLWRRSNEAWDQPFPGLHVSPWHDSHDASRLFLHDLIWQLPVKGDHVAIAPNRIALLVAGADDPEALVALGELAQAALDDDRPISGVAHRLDGNRWVPWLPPADHPAHAPLKMAAAKSRARDYAEQKDLLERLHEQSGRDCYVAGFEAMHDKADGRIVTFTFWVEGITDALMAGEAEYICLGQGDDPEHQTTLWARMADARAGAAELFEETGHIPKRYCVRAFPTAAQLQAMGARPDTPPW